MTRVIHTTAWTVLTAFALFLLLLVATSCQSPTAVVTTQTVVIGETPTPAPSPTQPGTASGFDEVGVGIFGYSAGCSNPATGNTVRLGCAADITATPKLAGMRVPETVHGPYCTWFLNGERINGVASTPVVKITIESNPFNVSAQGLSPGSFTLEAEVKGVRSAPRGFTVQ